MPMNTNTETIKVAYVNEPQAGKKQGTIKTEDGRYFGVYPDKLNQFQVGNTYEIEYSSRQWNGKTLHSVTGVKSSSTSQSTNGNGAQAPTSGDDIRWGNAKNVAAQLIRAGISPDNFSAFAELANLVYALQPDNSVEAPF